MAFGRSFACALLAETPRQAVTRGSHLMLPAALFFRAGLRETRIVLPWTVCFASFCARVSRSSSPFIAASFQRRCAVLVRVRVPSLFRRIGCALFSWTKLRRLDFPVRQRAEPLNDVCPFNSASQPWLALVSEREMRPLNALALLSERRKG